MKNREAAGGVVIFLFGVATVVLSLKMDIGSLRAAGPGFFPLCLGILLTVLSSVSVLRVLIPARKVGGEGESRPEASVSSGHVLLFLGGVVLAVLLFQWLGYALSSFLLLLFLLRVLGFKPWHRNVLVSFTAALFSYLLFVQWLKIPLPRGWIGL